MKKNIFTVSRFSVMNFCRNKARRRVVACMALLGMLVVGSVPAFGATPVLADNGLGGAAYNTAVGATIVPNTELSAAEIAEKALRIAASICVFTNDHIIVETL